TLPLPADSYPLSLHDALPIYCSSSTLSLARITPLSAYSAATFSSTGVSALHGPHHSAQKSRITSLSREGSTTSRRNRSTAFCSRSEEHTSELQSRENLVCRLL